MSSIMRRRNGLTGASVMACSCLEVRFNTSILRQDPRTAHRAPPPAFSYRESGLVP